LPAESLGIKNGLLRITTEEASVKAVHCPCGEVIEADTDDELVEKTQQHVREHHPDLEGEYTRDKILSIAHEH
jgi:hypothetical protein